VFDRAYKVHLAAAKDPGRYARQDVRIDGGRLIATDGRILAVVPASIEGTAPAYLPAAAVEAATKGKAPKGDDGQARIALNGTGATVLTKAGRVEHDYPAGGEFPRWEAVVPRDEPAFRIAFNPELLARLVGAIGAGEAVVFEFRAPDRPIVLRPSGKSEAFGVLMPITIDDGGKGGK
jgi:hypothetical protein